jgi:hypothetical protein
MMMMARDGRPRRAMDDAWMMDATTMEMTTTTTVVPTTRDEDDGCEGYARDVFVSASPVKYGLDAEWVVVTTTTTTTMTTTTTTRAGG